MSKNNKKRTVHIDNNEWKYLISGNNLFYWTPDNKKGQVNIKELGFGTDREYHEYKKDNDGKPLITNWGTYWQEITPFYIKRIIESKVLQKDIEIFNQKYKFVWNNQEIKLSNIEFLKGYLRLTSLSESLIKQIEKDLSENNNILYIARDPFGEEIHNVSSLMWAKTKEELKENLDISAACI